jgi:hypothetical protein
MTSYFAICPIIWTNESKENNKDNSIGRTFPHKDREKNILFYSLKGSAAPQSAFPWSA